VLSGVFSCSAAVVLSGDGANQSASGSCEDNAGNVGEPPASVGINIDRTPPLLNGSRTAANASGWNNSQVTVTFVCSDALSGVSVAPLTPQLVTGEGRGQSRAATCTDRAGNTATQNVENISIDLTAPVTRALPAPSPNAAGWNNTAVVVSFSATDALSGVGACTSNVALQEGRGQSASGQCVDLAGNSAGVTASGINVDLTPPVASALAAPAANSAGWNTTAVTVSFAGTDALSGIRACTPNVVLSQEGAGHSASGACDDLAGNSSPVTASGINIDLTAPVMACSATPDVNWPPNHSLVPVTTMVTLTDSLSAAASFRLIGAANSEPDARVANDTLGTDMSADIQGFELLTADTQGIVRAERNGSGPGRQYTFRYEAFDRAGNRAECTITVVVPHDMD
jgi:hypothetical protein